MCVLVCLCAHEVATVSGCAGKVGLLIHSCRNRAGAYMFIRSYLLLRTNEFVYLCRVILLWSVRLLRVALVAPSGVSLSVIVFAVGVSAFRCL